jgi:hypothetical protein
VTITAAATSAAGASIRTLGVGKDGIRMLGVGKDGVRMLGGRAARARRLTDVTQANAWPARALSADER